MRAPRAIGLVAIVFASSVWAPEGLAKPSGIAKADAKGTPAKPKETKAAPKARADAKGTRDAKKAEEPAKSPAKNSDAPPGSPPVKVETREEAKPAPSAAVPKPPPDPGALEAPGPGAGQGDRSVRSSPAPKPPADPEPQGAAKAAEPPKPARGAKGSKTPVGAPAVPDDDARRAIAGGPTADDLVSLKNDPELRELGLAERVLFPKPLRGVRVGFSWDAPDSGDGAVSVEASGLPPEVPFSRVETKPESTKDAAWLRSLGMPNLPTRLDARVVKYLKFYRDDVRGRNILKIWAKKCGRFSPALRAEFAKAGLPTDLIWLSLIESGHNPVIVSSAGAAGLWQFVPESARMYGLTVDRWVDERLDPELETIAAVRYLSDLRTRFGSWELAMAAYNMGHGGLLRAVRKFNTNDFWALSRFEAGLPWETTLYVPKILATALAMANKKAFGIDEIEQDLPISFDTLYVGTGVDLADVARAAEVPVESVRELNAAYLAGRTPPQAPPGRRFAVRVPAGKGAGAELKLAEGARRVSSAAEPHAVRFGDTLDSIAAEVGTTVRELCQLNHVAADERLRAGSVLFVPRTAAADPPKAAEDEVVVVPARRFAEGGNRRVFYRVLPGDELAGVAAAFGVAPSAIVLWNGLDSSARLQQGMTLQVFVGPSADLSRVRHLAEHEARVLVAGTEEFFEYFESQNGRKRFTVLAKKGDTLASIGRRYGMSAGMMERINRMPASTAVAAGDRVIVYSKLGAEGAAGPEPDLARELSAITVPMPDALPPLPPQAPEAGASNGLRAVVP